MSPRQWLLFGAVPAALALGACSENPAEPPDSSDVSFHAISVKCDFFTGGGFVGAGGKKITFGLHAGRSAGGTVFGHLTAVDHRTKTRYQSTRITRYGRPVTPFFASIPGGGVTRVFEGQVRVNGGAVRSFAAYVNDSGEPGRNVDRILLRVGNSLVIAGSLSGGLPTLRTLGGGNLQYHDHCIPGNPRSGK
jgi:hypothetical protein